MGSSWSKGHSRKAWRIFVVCQMCQCLCFFLSWIGKLLKNNRGKLWTSLFECLKKLRDFGTTQTRKHVNTCSNTVMLEPSWTYRSVPVPNESNAALEGGASQWGKAQTLGFVKRWMIGRLARNRSIIASSLLLWLARMLDRFAETPNVDGKYFWFRLKGFCVVYFLKGCRSIGELCR